jgi:hypothetical protein
MGEMKRAIAFEEHERRKQDRYISTVVIAASIIAGCSARTRRHQHTNTTAETAVANSVSLARMILKRVLDR